MSGIVLGVRNCSGCPELFYMRVLVFMLHTCACVHGALFLNVRCVHIAYMCVCSCWVHVFVFMLHASACVHVTVKVRDSSTFMK